MKTLYPYKISLTQEQDEDDGDRRLQFCDILSTEPQKIQTTFFQYIKTLFFNGRINRHSSRYCSVEMSDTVFFELQR